MKKANIQTRSEDQHPTEEISKDGRRTSIGASVNSNLTRGRILVVDEVLPEGERFERALTNRQGATP